MSSFDRLRKLLDIVLTEDSVSPISNILSAAATIEKTIPAILNALGISYLNEAAETGRTIEVSIEEAGTNHNIYKVKIPVKTIDGKSLKPHVTYVSIENAKREGEADDDATSRIIEQIKQEVKDFINAHKKAKKEGRDEDARKILDKLTTSYDEAKQEFKRAETKTSSAKKKPSRAAIRAMTALRKSRADRAKFLHSQGLLAKQDITKALNIKNQNTLMQFAINSVLLISKKFPKWKMLGDVDGIGLKDIDKALPEAKINNELIKFVMANYKINAHRLSRDAAEAVAAASLIVAATIKAAAKSTTTLKN